MKFSAQTTITSFKSTGKLVAKLAAILAVTLVAAGCATPTGAAFTTAETVPTGQAQIYLYRKSALQAGGATFDVQLNKQDMGILINGSYVRLTVAPGEHVLGVKPGALSKMYETTLKLADQQTQYVEFAVPALVLANPFMLGSEITLRAPEQAAADMQGLKGVK